MRAKLRRGIGKPPGALPEIWGITLANIPDEWHSHSGNASFEENAIHATLTLYALHRQGKEQSMNAQEKTEESPRESIGSATAQLVQPDESNLGAIKRRFDAMATAPEITELVYHARGIIQLLKANDIPLNYPRFAEDLFWFQCPGQADRVRLRWGEGFYRVLTRNNKNKERENE